MKSYKKYIFNVDACKINYSDDYIASHFRDTDESGNKCRIRTEAGVTRVYYPDRGMIPNDTWNDINNYTLWDDIYYENPMSKVRTG